MLITDAERTKYFKGYFIYDCAIRQSAVFSFLLFQHGDDPYGADKRLLNYFPNDAPGERFGDRNLLGFENPQLAITKYPTEKAVVVSMHGGVIVLGAGPGSGMEQKIPHGRDDLPMYTNVSGITSINGYVYAVGGWRAVAKRVDANQWVAVHDRKTLPKPRSNGGLATGGFRAISGFSEDDLYCVGDDGDVWRFDGVRWHHCALPTNMDLWSVYCADDGYVYIGGASGSVIKGRGDKWKIIYKGEFSLPFKDVVWFEDRLWCTSDHGLWTVHKDKLTAPELPAGVTACSGNLSAGYGKLLLAGMGGATVYDGKHWERLV
jgi:hypothetical protein